MGYLWERAFQAEREDSADPKTRVGLGISSWKSRRPVSRGGAEDKRGKGK